MTPLKYNFKRLFSVRFARKALVFILVAFLFQLLISPVARIVDITFDTAHASTGKTHKVEDSAERNDPKEKEDSRNTKTRTKKVNEKEEGEKEREYLPETKSRYAVERTIYTTVTAYNSERSQCQGDPCITATGFNVCKHGIEDTVATNRLPFGTKVKIPEFFGDRIFIVRDRMNRRYHNRVDVWMISKKEAINFGVNRGVRVQILKRR